ncbi:MAG: CBS domain-containing protein [Pseudomonadota bacterium]
MTIVKELMSRKLYTLKPTDTIHQARQLMLSKQIRHIPVVNEQGKFVGLLTKRDLLAISVSALAEIDTVERDELETGIPISGVMVTDVVVAQEEATLLEAAQFMLKQKHGCLPIFSGEQLVGILTEGDFVKLAIHLMEAGTVH